MIPVFRGLFSMLLVLLPLAGFGRPDHPVNPVGLENLPESAFKRQLEKAPREVRVRALERFNELEIPLNNVASLHVGSCGELHYGCFQGHREELAKSVFLEENQAMSAATVASASVPVASPPAYHSKPDAPYAIYLDFNGGTISGTRWNADYNSGNDFDCYAWSNDGDYTTFSDAEQADIRRIWQRIAEDYAPFNVNVTTDVAFDPDTTGGSNNVGWLLFTRDEDKNGTAMPAKGGGGVAWVGVFGISSYASTYSPALVYADNLGPNVEHFMAEAGSHEMGHNMGLSHDGTSTREYYAGHGSGETSWGPIMGGSYYMDITTWSRGEYFDANEPEDDMAVIAGKVGFRPDDIRDTPQEAEPLVLDGEQIRAPLTYDFSGDDWNEGIINSQTDQDVFQFQTGGGTVSIEVTPFIAENTTYSFGNNLDIKVVLSDASGLIIASSDSVSTSAAAINAVVPEGTYYLSIEGTGSGSPLSDPPSGYTDYGSLGMYFITGSIPLPPPVPPVVIDQLPALSNLVEAGMTRVTIGFSEPMDPASFSLTEDILRFTGPGGIDLTPEITGYVWSANNDQLSIDFLSQSLEGYYRMIIGSQVTDLDGSPLDQDNDGIVGEAVEDDFALLFQIGSLVSGGSRDLLFLDMETDPNITLGTGWERGTPAQGALGGPSAAYSGTSVLALNLDGAYAAGLTPASWLYLPQVDAANASGLSLEFQRWLGVAYKDNGSPTGRHADYAYVEISPDGINWTSVWTTASGVNDSGWLRQTISLPESTNNQSQLSIRIGLQSDDTSESYGWNLDDVRLSGFVEAEAPTPPPPLALGHQPRTESSGGFSGLYLEFSQPMNPASFSLSEILSLTGPVGAIVPSAIRWISESVALVEFPEQSLDGLYSMVVSSQLRDTHNQLLDQDGDGLSGEDPEDRYLAEFSIAGLQSLSPAESWRFEFFGTTENTGNAADNFDYDQDGSVNLLERAFGTDPTAAGSVSRPGQTPLAIDGAVYLSTTYQRIAGGTGSAGIDYTSDGILYTVEYADGLGGIWNSGNITVVLISGPVDGLETVTVRLNEPLAPGTRQFIRLNIQPVP